MSQPEISDSEWQVMNVVWETQPTTASKVIACLASVNQWSPATIRTFLHRLVKKGALLYEQDGNRYLYRASISKSSCIRKAGRSFLSSVFSGETGPLLTHFVKDCELSAEEIEELKKLLDQKEPKND